jgi:Fe-S cluster biogenesis protein NfuA
MSDSLSLRDRVARLLAEEIAPALQMDATGIELCEVTDDGVVHLRLSGVCGSCPSSIMAVINGIEQELRRQIPEFGYLEVLP